MFRKILVALTLIALHVVPVTAQQDVEEEFRKTLAEYRTLKTDEEKFKIWYGFLDSFPDSRYTFSIMQFLVNGYFLEQANNPDGATKFIDGMLGKIVDPDIRTQAKGLFIPVYGMAGKINELRALADAMSEEGKLGYIEHTLFQEAAIEAEAWDMVLEHSDATLALSTPEAVKADFPNRNFSEEELGERAGDRKANSLTNRGWALINLGKAEEGIAAFEEANEYVGQFYVGFPDNNLGIYWAKALIKQGEHESAMKKIAAEAVFGFREEPKKILQELFAKRNGGEEGYEDFVWELRKKLAKTTDDFTLPDYDGQNHKFSDLRGKVTLLAFWFPT